MVRCLATLLSAALLGFTGNSPGKDVVLAVPISLQPYFIPITDTGLAFETIEAAFGTQGLTVRPALINSRENFERWDRILSGDRGIDCAALLTEPQTRGWYSVDDAYAFHDHAFTLAARGLEIDRVDDLSGKTVIAYLGASGLLGPEFREVSAQNPRYREIGNHRAQVKLLLAGRVDVIIADRLLTRWYLEHLRTDSGQSMDVTFHDLFPPSPGKFACHSRELIDAYSAGLEAIRASGKLESIRSSYLE